MGMLDGRELSPPSMNAQARAATINRIAPTQPRIGARRQATERAMPIARAAKPRTSNVRKDVMDPSYAERSELSHAGPRDVNRAAERQPLPGVRCSVLFV